MPKQSRPGIYCITNLATGEKYVGSSLDIKRRWEAHKSCLRAGTHHNKRLQEAFDRYGEDAFSWEQLMEVVNPSELRRHEQAYIESLAPAYNQATILVVPVAQTGFSLPLSLIHRLEAAKRQTGKSATRLVTEALERYLDKLERQRPSRTLRHDRLKAEYRIVRKLRVMFPPEDVEF